MGSDNLLDHSLDKSNSRTIILRDPCRHRMQNLFDTCQTSRQKQVGDSWEIRRDGRLPSPSVVLLAEMGKESCLVVSDSLQAPSPRFADIAVENARWTKLGKKKKKVRAKENSEQH